MQLNTISERVHKVSLCKFDKLLVINWFFLQSIINPILKLDVSERLLSGFESGKLDFHFSVKKLTQHCWHLKVWGGPLRKRWIEKGSAHHCQHQVKWGVDMKYSEKVKNLLCHV